MNTEDNAKKSIFEHLQKEVMSQEYEIRKIIEEISFSKQEIDSFISDRLKVDDDIKTRADLARLRCYFTSRYFYESVSKEGEQKQRDLDLLAHFEIENTSRLVFQLTLLGDIKSNDEYKWVFSSDVTTDEVEMEKMDFPIVALNRPTTIYHIGLESFFVLDDLATSNQPKPYANKIFTFFKSGNVIDNDRKDIPRRFFEQIIQGVEHFYWNSKNPFPEEEIPQPMYHIIIPVLVTSSNYYYTRTLPPSSLDELVETDFVLYFYNPTKPTVINQWRIPILIIAQSSLEQILKKLILAFKEQCWNILKLG